MNTNARKGLPVEQKATHIVRVANGWVIYEAPFGYDIRNDRNQPPQLVFTRMADAVVALLAWGALHEEQA